MLDNALITLLISIIQAGLNAQGFTVKVKSSNQPTKQPDPAMGDDTVFVVKVNDRLRGSPKQRVTTANSIATLTETQRIDTRFNVSAEAVQNPANQAQTTAADYVKAVSRVLQSAITIATLQAQGVGIFRIQEIITTYFDNDLGGFEASPMCEIILTHNDTLTQTVNTTSKVVPNVTSL